MFAEFDAVGVALASATAPDGEVVRDRGAFLGLLAAAEAFFHKNDLVVGGAAAKAMLLGRPLGVEDLRFDALSTRPAPHAKALAVELFEACPGGIGRQAEVLDDGDGAFTVKVANRPLCTLVPYEGEGAEAVVPSERDALFARDGRGEPLRLLCLGGEQLLIRLYGRLCSPVSAGCWAEDLDDEKLMRAAFRKEASQKIARVGAGATGGAPGPPKALMKALVRSFAGRKDHVLVGGFAAGLVDSESAAPGRDRLQVVTETPLRSAEKEVAAVAARAGFQVDSRYNALGLPNEPRHRRLTMYAVTGQGRTPFLDVFNAGQFSLIPFVRKRVAAPWGGGGVQFGTPFLRLAFLLVDSWTIRVLFQKKAVEQDYAQRLLKGFLAEFGQVAAEYERLVQGGASTPCSRRAT